MNTEQNYFHYAGVVHIHSTYSDGSGSINEIMHAAVELGLDYAIITDHNTLRARLDGYEGYYCNGNPTRPTLCMISYEANDMHDQNHYLSLGLDRTVHKRKSAKEYAAAVREAGGFGFIAHPHEKRDEFDEYPPFPWTEWGAEFDGIEIWNHMSEWMEGLKKKNKLHRAIHPLRSIIEPPKETIELWDKVNQERKVIAIGGVDAHAHIVNFFGLKLKIFPYKVCFKSIRTYAILKSPIDSLKPIEEERLKIYQALREGNSYIANAYLGDAKGFLFKAIQGEKEFIMGDTVQFDSTPIELVVNTPKSVTLRLIRNGKPIYETNGKSLSYKLSQEGIYRVEARQEKKAWIYSNAIRVIK